MRWTQTFIPTLKEDPSDAEVLSHKLMFRAGFIRRLGSGTYSYLPLGLKVLRKIEGIVRDQMNRAGGLEVLLPAMQPAELWKRGGRMELLKEILITYKDRSGKINIFGPTHEEVITDLVAREISSYRDLPKILYQIQTKFRDEPRPRFGVLRSKEFIMKDAYSFDTDEKGLDAVYKRMRASYRRIFERCGLECIEPEADSGFMGGDVSHEFMAPAACGEDTVNGKPAIELGHIFKLGTKYSKVLGASYLDEKGGKKYIVMGCYGIGINRIFAAAIEQNNDTDGIIWPEELSPYEIAILPLNTGNAKVKKAAEEAYAGMLKEGLDVIIDDRDERAGVKFKDADLIGFSTQVVIGEKNLEKGKVEIKKRKDKKSVTVGKGELINRIKKEA